MRDDREAAAVDSGRSAERAYFLSTAAATPGDRRAAFAVVALSLTAFLISLPFARHPLAPLPGFIPFYQSALITNDLITAVLLFAQFKILRSRGLLLVASGYLFTAAIAVVHTLTFPGLFSAAGLLGAGPQSTAWLYMFWHGGFPLLVLAYALAAGAASDERPLEGRGRFDVAICVALVLSLAVALSVVAVSAHDSLPRIMWNGGYTSMMLPVAAGVMLLSVGAAVLLAARGLRSVLDLWLMVSMCTLALDVALSAVFNAGRFDLGFYAGRIYGLVATGTMLIVLLYENTRLYGLLLDVHHSERAKAAELRRLSVLDPLTRIPNRRAFEEAIDREWRRALRHGTPLCLLMIDVDCFKRYNDRYGHVSGDQCLRAVAEVLASNTRRAGEMAARYGGEEFAVLLPQVSAEDALRLAERICDDIRALDIPHEGSTVTNHVTLSIGLADALKVAAGRGSAGRSELAWTQLVESADGALYAAKNSGRDRVGVASPHSQAEPAHHGAS
jgi:diguanylate cyclase (GGDEF)-like protein